MLPEATPASKAVSLGARSGVTAVRGQRGKAGAWGAGPGSGTGLGRAWRQWHVARLELGSPSWAPQAGVGGQLPACGEWHKP